MARRPHEPPEGHAETPAEDDEPDDELDDGWRARLLRGIAEIALYIIPVLIIFGVIWLASVIYHGRE